MTILEKTAYIKGLCEGLGIDGKDTAEAKIIKALLDLCQDMAEEIDALGSDVEDLIDYCEELDEDLGDVEEVLLDMDEEDEDEEWDDEDEWDECCDCDCDCDDCDCDCCCDDDYFEIVCPSCGETVCFDSELDPENMLCPACGEKFGCIVDEDDFKAISEEE